MYTGGVCSVYCISTVTSIVLMRGKYIALCVVSVIKICKGNLLVIHTKFLCTILCKEILEKGERKVSGGRQKKGGARRKLKVLVP